MTDIESNILYRTILKDFRHQFDVACRRSYVIALPVNESLHNANIDQVFVNSHILMPSKLLKMHYNPLQVGYAAHDIELDRKRLIIHPSAKNHPSGEQREEAAKKITVKILAEEMCYNNENKPFRLLIIDRPLISNANSNEPEPSSVPLSGSNRQRSLTLRSLNFFGKRNRSRVRYLEPPELLLDHNDCSRYLETISQQLTVQLEREAQQIQSKYMILSHYLRDAAERIAQLAESFIPKYIGQLDVEQHPQWEKIIESIKIAVENYVIHLLHGKLIASIYHRYDVNDSTFDKKLQLIKQSQLSICQLGAQEPFRALEIDDNIKGSVRAMVSQQSPLAMVNTIVQILDGISSNLDNCVRANQLLTEFDNQKAVESVSICSDDLIASLILALVEARPSRVYSMSKYLELFNWSSRDRAAYHTATFHVVVQYIYNYNNDNNDNS